MLIQNINPLTLALALLKNGKRMGSRHSLLDQAALLVINNNPNCSQLDIEEAIYGTRQIDNGAIYGPLKRLRDSGFVDVVRNEGAASRLGEGRTSVKLTKNGEAFLRSCRYNNDKSN